MTTRSFCTSDQKCTFPYFASIPIIAFLSALLLFILRSRRKEPESIQVVQRREEVKSIQLPAEVKEKETPERDDLTKIEGIGPKVSSTLTAFGITTFKQLARLKAEVIKEILVKAGNRISNPTTWPEQARLAAAGKWKELADYQAELKGGRPG